MPYIQSTTTENTVDSTSSNSTDVSQLFVEEVPQQTSEESLERQRINNMSFIELFKELGRIGYGTENTSLTHEFALQELINHASSNNEMPYTEIVKYVFEQHWGEGTQDFADMYLNVYHGIQEEYSLPPRLGPIILFHFMYHSHHKELSHFYIQEIRASLEHAYQIHRRHDVNYLRLYMECMQMLANKWYKKKVRQIFVDAYKQIFIDGGYHLDSLTTLKAFFQKKVLNPHSRPMLSLTQLPNMFGGGPFTRMKTLLVGDARVFISYNDVVSIFQGYESLLQHTLLTDTKLQLIKSYAQGGIFEHLHQHTSQRFVMLFEPALNFFTAINDDTERLPKIIIKHTADFVAHLGHLLTDEENQLMMRHIELYNTFSAIDDSSYVKIISKNLELENREAYTLLANDFSNAQVYSKNDMLQGFMGFINEYEIIDGKDYVKAKFVGIFNKAIKQINSVKNENIEQAQKQYFMAMQEAALHQRSINRMLVDMNDDTYSVTLVDNVMNGIEAIQNHPLSLCRPVVSGNGDICCLTVPIIASCNPKNTLHQGIQMIYPPLALVIKLDQMYTGGGCITTLPHLNGSSSCRGPYLKDAVKQGLAMGDVGSLFEFYTMLHSDYYDNNPYYDGRRDRLAERLLGTGRTSMVDYQCFIYDIAVMSGHDDFKGFNLGLDADSNRKSEQINALGQSKGWLNVATHSAIISTYDAMPHHAKVALANKYFASFYSGYNSNG